MDNEEQLTKISLALRDALLYDTDDNDLGILRAQARALDLSFRRLLAMTFSGYDYENIPFYKLAFQAQGLYGAALKNAKALKKQETRDKNPQKNDERTIQKFDPSIETALPSDTQEKTGENV